MRLQLVVAALSLCAGFAQAQDSAVPAGQFDALSATQAGADCLPLADIGCLYLPPAAVRGEMTLLIYFRGHWRDYRGQVPEELRVESARSALIAYGLKTLADRTGMAVLVTGSSSVGIGAAELAAARSAASRSFTRLVLSAHSGGYVGLEKSLSALPPVSRIVMLDDFYFDTGLTTLIKSRIDNGAVCTGFVTQHSRARWEARFKPFVSCPVDLYQDSEHEAAVPRCLGAYLDRTTCL